MLRSEQGIKDFAKSLALESISLQFDSIYCDLFKRQEADILQNGTSYDTSLLSVDLRRCHAVYFMFTTNSWNPTSIFNQFLKELERIVGSNHVYYQVCHDRDEYVLRGNLHFTLFQLIGFDMFDLVHVPEDYHKIVCSIVSNFIPEFSVVFHSVVITPRSIMMLGTPSVNLNYMRDLVRREFGRLGMPIMEPYRSDLAHATLLRFTEQIDTHRTKSLICLTKQFRNCFMGTLRIDSFKVGPASWKMQNSELHSGGPLI